jgi:hypothetical protein
VITGRKSVEGAIVEGMLGLLKRQCRKMALKTRNCGCQIMTKQVERTMLTCHASGTFLRFARTKSVAIIRDVLPGPVKVFRRAPRILSREPVTLRTSATVNARDFSGRRAPEAMAKGVTGKEREKEGMKCVREKNKQQTKKVR